MEWPVNLKEGQILQVDFGGKDIWIRAKKDAQLQNENHFHIVVKVLTRPTNNQLSGFELLPGKPGVPLTKKGEGSFMGTIVSPPAKPASTEVDVPDMPMTATEVTKVQSKFNEWLKAGILPPGPVQVLPKPKGFTTESGVYKAIHDKDSEVLQQITNRVTELMYDIATEFGYEIVVNKLVAFPDALSSATFMGLQFKVTPHA